MENAFQLKEKAQLHFKVVQVLKALLMCFMYHILIKKISVGQLFEKGYNILFEDKMYLIKEAKWNDMSKVKMKGKIFALDPMEEVHAIVSIPINAIEL